MSLAPSLVALDPGRVGWFPREALGSHAAARQTRAYGQSAFVTASVGPRQCPAATAGAGPEGPPESSETSRFQGLGSEA